MTREEIIAVVREAASAEGVVGWPVIDAIASRVADRLAPDAAALRGIVRRLYETCERAPDVHMFDELLAAIGGVK